MERVIVIAEAGVNHNGSMDIAKALIDAAAASGADYVKFQTFKSELLASVSAEKAAYQIKAEGKNGDMEESQLEMLRKLELKTDDFAILKDYSTKKGIGFLSTPFDLKSLEVLADLDMDFIKISSGDLNNAPLLEKSCKLNKSIILSTGMANFEEVEDAVNLLLREGVDLSAITVLQCNTEYPTPYHDVNLRVMKTYTDKLGTSVGFSDHTIGNECAIAAVALGARVIEKHLTLDRKMKGPDHQASSTPEDFKQLVASIRNVELAMGISEKKPSLSEMKNIRVARKSIYVVKDMKKGDRLNEEDVIMKRPASGLSPMIYKSLVGKRLKRDLGKDSLLQLEDIE